MLSSTVATVSRASGVVCSRHRHRNHQGTRSIGLSAAATNPASTTSASRIWQSRCRQTASVGHTWCRQRSGRRCLQGVLCNPVVAQIRLHILSWHRASIPTTTRPQMKAVPFRLSTQSGRLNCCQARLERSLCGKSWKTLLEYSSILRRAVSAPPLYGWSRNGPMNLPSSHRWVPKPPRRHLSIGHLPWCRITSRIAPSPRKPFRRRGPTCLRPLIPMSKRGLENFLTSASRCRISRLTVRGKVKTLPMKVTCRHCLRRPLRTPNPSSPLHGKACMGLNRLNISDLAGMLLSMFPVEHFPFPLKQQPRPEEE